jgi:hypothetical protein
MKSEKRWTEKRNLKDKFRPQPSGPPSGSLSAGPRAHFTTVLNLDPKRAGRRDSPDAGNVSPSPHFAEFAQQHGKRNPRKRPRIEPLNRQRNIQHSTFNAQYRRGSRCRLRSGLEVECRRLNVLESRNLQIWMPFGRPKTPWPTAANAPRVEVRRPPMAGGLSHENAMVPWQFLFARGCFTN